MAKRRKNKVDVKLIRGNKISNTSKPDVESYKELVEEGKKVEKIVDPVLIISRVDYPITIEYAGRKLRLSPREKAKVADRSKLQEDLPKGLYLKKLSK